MDLKSCNVTILVSNEGVPVDASEEPEDPEEEASSRSPVWRIDRGSWN